MDVIRDFATDFDHTDPTFLRNAITITADLRARCPVAHGKVYDGFYALSRQSDIIEILRDNENFSCENGTVIPPIENATQALPFESDPPEHTIYRRLLASWFAVHKINKYEVLIRQQAIKLINSLEEEGACDLFSSFIVPFSASVLVLAMEFPPEEWPVFLNYMQRLIAVTIVKNQEEHQKVRQFFVHYLLRAMERRKQVPGNDLLSMLIMARPDGKALSTEEIVSIMISLFIAGVQPITNILSSLLLHLVEYPGNRQRLIDDPSLIPLFVEEDLRYNSPIQHIGRNVAKDMVLHEQSLTEGEKMLLLIGSANRDEAFFPNADKFILDRQPNRHIAFGHGIHFCLGAPLTRLELCIAIEEILRYLPDYQLNGSVKYDFLTGHLYAISALPVFSLRERLSNCSELHWLVLRSSANARLMRSVRMFYAAIDLAISDYSLVILDEEDNEMGTLAVTHSPEGVQKLVCFIQAVTDSHPQDQLACFLKTSNGMLTFPLLEKNLTVYIISPETISTFRNGLGIDSAVSDIYVMVKIGQREIANLAQLNPYGEMIDAKHESLLVIEPNFALRQAKAVKKAFSSFLPPDRFVSRGSSRHREVALTFDDGPHPPYTAQILDILQHYGILATFFFIGLQAECHPDLVKKAYDQQHIVANHTWSHPIIPSLLATDIDWQIKHSNQALVRILGVQPAFFRPPYGVFDLNALISANTLDLTTVLWDVSVADWRCPGAGVIASSALEQVQPGSILLLHDGGGDRSQTVAALPVIIEQLLQRDFHLITVQQLCSNIYR